MTARSLKKSHRRKCTSATGVEVNGKSSMQQTVPSTESMYSFKAINDLVIVEEDPMEPEVDKASGLTNDVVESIKSGKLHIPDIAQYALEKFPCKGKIISAGSLCKWVKVGQRVLFARLGGQRLLENDKSYVSIRESDIHAILTD